MNFQPLNDRLVIQRFEEEKQSAGGIIIPDSAMEKPVQGKVIAVGPGKVNNSGERVELHVKEGDVVLFSKYRGTNVKLEGEDFLILREDDVFGVIKQ